MLTLLSYLEAANHNNNRYGNNENDDINALEYGKQFYGVPYGGNGIDTMDTDNDAVNGGEWWNDWVEPSVQYYGNSPYGHFEPQNLRERHQSKGMFHIIDIFFFFILSNIY